MTHTPHLAVIGAGLAGLSCASALQQAGFALTVFDKSRGPSGRLSTRRGAGWQCDHGAQYFTARDPAFRAEVARWQQAGAATLWQPRVQMIDADGALALAGQSERFVGTPTMTAPAALLGAALDLRCEQQVSGLQREAGRWHLRTGDGWLEQGYDAVLLAVPAPQAAVLLAPVAPQRAAQAEAVEMRPCWAMMLQYDAPLPLAFDAAFVHQGPLRWVARDSSKPGRVGAESWLLHASAEWSAAHVDLAAPEVAALLLAAWAELGGAAPRDWSAHRWLYASTWPAHAEACVWDGGLGLGLCGDWLNGGTVEAAWLSGQALARQLAAALDPA